MIIKILICLGVGSRQIMPLADLVANWAQHFLGPSLPLFGKLGPSKLGPWKMLVWQIGPLQNGPFANLAANWVTHFLAL